MWEPFTNEARSVIVHAQEVANDQHHSYLGTEHLLLSMLDTPSFANQILSSLDIDLAAARQGLLSVADQENVANKDYLVFSIHAKNAVEAAFFAARQFGHNYIGAEHLLVGIIDGASPAAGVLKNLGATAAKIRESLAALSDCALPVPEQQETSSPHTDEEQGQDKHEA